MGYYTYFSYQARLNKDCPESVRNILKSSFDGLLLPCQIIEKEVGFFDRFSVTALIDDFVSISCSLKNYEENIEKFCRWIEPYVCYDLYQNYFGFYKGEELSSEPSFIAKSNKDGKIFYSLKEIIEHCDYWFH